MTTTTTTTTAPRWEDCGDIWVCTDCYFAHHYGATEHDGLWYTDGSDTPCDREPLAGLGDDIHVFDHTCSDHDTEDLYDDDGDSTGETTECQYCGRLATRTEFRNSRGPSARGVIPVWVDLATA